MTKNGFRFQLGVMAWCLAPTVLAIGIAVCVICANYIRKVSESDTFETPTLQTTSTTDPHYEADTALAQYERDIETHRILRVACYSRSILGRYLGARRANSLFTDDPEAKHLCGSIQCFNRETCKFVPIVFVDEAPAPQPIFHFKEIKNANRRKR